METPQEVVLRTLQDLRAEDFQTFQWYLQQKGALEDFPAIPKSELENANRVKTVDQMLSTYSMNTIKVTRIVLVKMNQNELVKNLSNTISEPAVLEDMSKTREEGELPKTLTEMYIHFLVVQSKRKKVKYDGGAEKDPHWSPDTRKMIKSLGKLAFEQLQKGYLIFYESDLTECGIDITAASVYSGVFTQIFKEERGLYQDNVFCFVHLSVHEFLAALHVHLTFTNSGINLLLEKRKPTWLCNVFRDKSAQFYQRAVAKAIQSPNGHLDLFLRFLLGLSLETNQTLLRGLLKQTGSMSETNKKTVEYIKKKIRENLSAERSINLFHCLNELNDGSLVEEIQQSLRSGSLSTDKLSPAQWSALVFILLSSEKDLDVFDLKKYSTSENALLRLLPVVKASNKALYVHTQLSR
ncbi:protein NLRC3-like [Sander lucioperca]|uniref:protein NLRC3-like n=1 Tax=Sander lucioperca TaxID=283035 RepID=UPI0016539D0A|nr:protein NLRC3-like [Sander lucioperca]